MVFHWSLSDSKSRQVSKTLLCILADLNDALVLMVTIRTPISNSSSLSEPLETSLWAPITIGVAVSLMCNCFLSFLARPKYRYFFRVFFFYEVYSVVGSFTFSYSLYFFFVNYHKSGFLAAIKWFVCIAKSQRILWSNSGRILVCVRTI